MQPTVPQAGGPALRRLRRPEARAGDYELELPISKQFTPNVIPSLTDFLNIARAEGPTTPGRSKSTVKEALARAFFAKQATGPIKRDHRTMGGNAAGSAVYWGLLNDDWTLTALGERLADPKQVLEEEDRVRAMVEHFLRVLGGAAIVSTIVNLIKLNGGMPKKDDFARQLAKSRIYENPDGTDHGALGQWLRHPAVGIFGAESSKWGFDETRFGALAGLGPAEVEAVAALDLVGLAILRELARSPDLASDSGTMQRLVGARTDLQIDAPAFRSKHLRPLEDAGMITIGPKGRAGAYTFKATDLGRKEVVQDLAERYEAAGGHRFSVADLLKPVSELLGEMDRTQQPDRGKRGKALELFALHLLDRIGLVEITWRSRPTNAEEIDGTATTYTPVHTRWQVQCKNTPKLTVDDAAKEVGLAVTNGSGVILLVVNGAFTPAAEDYISRAIRRLPLNIIAFGGADIAAFVAEPADLWRVLQRESSRAAKLRTDATRSPAEE